MRLNAYLAKASVASRRQADELIKAGLVEVNGRVGALNSNVSDADEVKVQGRRVSSQPYKYILLNKPAGFVTTLRDPQKRPKVTDLIKINERVVPVGRLDIDTTGLLLLTNDGVLAHKLMHPSSGVQKVYEVEVKGQISDKLLNKLSNGVVLEDGRTAPALARQLDNKTLELTLHEGRKRQVKRMVAAVGLQFVSLSRTKYGPLTCAGLKPGQWRELTMSEIKHLEDVTMVR